MVVQISDILLLEDSILEKYGLYTDTETNKESWLESQKDSGKLYKDLYAKVLEKSIVIQNTAIVKDLDAFLMIHITNALSKEDNLVFLKVLEYFKKDPNFKTKIEKLSREMNVQDVERLSKVYDIPINRFVYTKFNVKMTHRNMYVHPANSLDETIEKYKEAIENQRNSIKFVETKKKYLLKELENYNSGIGLEKYDRFKRINREPSKFKGMNWSGLSIDEKYECIREYVYERGSQKNQEKEKIEEFYRFVVANYDNKTLLYRNIKWYKEYGRIRDISNIYTNQDTGVMSVVQPSKITCQKTIFETNPDKINEEILYYILSHNYTVDQCITKIQTVFNIQKISPAIVRKIGNLYNEMKNVIKDNPYSEFESS